MWDATGRICENSTYMYLGFLCIYGLSRSFFLVGVYSIGVDIVCFTHSLFGFLALSLVGGISVHCITLPAGTVLVGHCGNFLWCKWSWVCFCVGGIMCCKLFHSVHRTPVEHVYCCLLVVRFAVVHCVITSEHCFISPLQSVKVLVLDVHRVLL
jgi:hypothetical protein